MSSAKMCCVPGCTESTDSRPTLHFFPNPNKHRERFNQWLYAIGGDILAYDNNYIYKQRTVCHAHFEEKFCCHYNRLSKNAVPTLNLNGPTALTKLKFSEKSPLKKNENIPQIALPIATSPATPLSDSESFVDTSSNADCIQSTKKLVKKDARLSPLEQKLYKKIYQARVKISKFRNKIRKELANIKAAKNMLRILDRRKHS